MERKVSLREIAVSEIRKKFDQSSMKTDLSVERTLLVVGSKFSGKSSIIHHLIEKDSFASDKYLATYLLEYVFGRQSGKSLAKDICHIWELGNGTRYRSLLSTVITDKVDSLTVVAVIDLNNPGSILSITEILLNDVRSNIMNHSRTLKPRHISSDVEEDDRKHLNPFPIQLVIIGGKYDLFQNMEPAKKRIICQYLRCTSHIMQADLIFHSNSDPSLKKKTREFLLHYAFGVSLAKNTVIADYNKPLRIPAGSDSFRSIQGPHATTVAYTLDKYKNALLTHFNQEINEEIQLPDDPAADFSFQEPSIDDLCRQKLEELNHIIEERNRREQAVQNRKLETTF